MADTYQVLNLAAIIREVDGNHSKGAAALAESILDHPGFRAALADEPAEPIPPAALPEGYIDPEHSEDDRALLQTFYSACQAEGGTADEVTLRGLRAVLARWGRPAPAPPADVSQLSDGYHTFAELYEHRHSLMLALMRALPRICWFSRRHADGELPFGSDDWFIVGAELPGAPITYHLPAALYSLAQKTGALELPAGRPWDGHSAADVVHRLRDWAIEPTPPADGEVAELAEWLREQLHVCLQAPWTPGIKHFGRAAELIERLSTTQKELERERLRLAVCGVVAMADTPETAAKARDCLPEYWSASADDIARQIDKLMRLIEEHYADEPAAPAPPADGEVAELVEWLQEEADDYECRMMTDFLALCAELADAYLRTLEHINNSTWLGYEPSDDPLLQRARASLAELAAWLQDSAAKCRRAAELLQRQALVPVSVSERPWEREGWCDVEGRFWAEHISRSGVASWRCAAASDLGGWAVRCLPAHALPLPEVGS